jgi:hypothetical protein
MSVQDDTPDHATPHTHAPTLITFPVELPTLMGSVIEIDTQEGYGIGLSLILADRADGMRTRLSIGQARAVAAQLLAAADTYQKSGW